MQELTVIRWGILGPGNIAKSFTHNLLTLASSSPNRSPGITHQITGVASSTSLSTAQTFINTNIHPHQTQLTTPCTAYNNYTSLALASDIDIIYIATPHSSHFRTAYLCLSNHKPVLVEKPLAVTAAQAQQLTTLAKTNGVFLMEAMWTRFFPLTRYVQDAIQAGTIGEVVRVTADFSLGLNDEEGVKVMFGDDGGRMLDPARAGGVLLDLGVYALTWAFLSVYHLVPKELCREPYLVGAAMTPHLVERKWVDVSSTLLLTMPSAPSCSTMCHVVASTSLYVTSDPGYGGDDPRDAHAHRYSVPSTRIQGTHGEIQIFGPLPRPQRVRIFTKVRSGAVTEGSGGDIVPGNVVESSDGRGYRIEEKVFESMGDGNGMYWEADEAARCLRDGKLESDLMPWEETIAVMQIMDEARRRCGLEYGPDVEGVDLM